MINKETINCLRDIKTVLDNAEVPFWLDSGLLLGMVRDKKPISYDHDIDIGTMYQDIKEKLKADGNDPSLVIQQTILRGWSGLFPLKEDYSKEETLEEWTKRVSQT